MPTPPMHIPPVQVLGERGEVRPIKITPTDVSQFVRYESCERFARLQLHARNVAYRFLESHGLHAQALAPLLFRSGADFEARLEGALLARAHQDESTQADESTHDFARLGETEIDDRLPDDEVERASGTEEAVQFASQAQSGNRRRSANTEQVLEMARELLLGPPNKTLWLLQPRLVVAMHGWEVRGDLDVLRLRKSQDGRLQVLVADMKASPKPKVDQKLQVAFYHEMLEEMLQSAHIEHEPIACGVLYRGPLDISSVSDPDERALLQQHGVLAQHEFGEILPGESESESAYFDPMPDALSFVREAHTMVFEPNSPLQQAASKPYEELKWYLGAKCDPCPFSEWCMRSAWQDDDLSLLPHLTPDVKAALRARGVHTVADLAHLKRLKSTDEIRAALAVDTDTSTSSTSSSPSSSTSGASSSTWGGTSAEDEHVEPDDQAWNELEAVPEHESQVRSLSSARGLGARLDEVVLRAHALMLRRDRDFSTVRARKKLSRRGHGSLPVSAPDLNPNLVTLYLDAQHDFLQERAYALCALVVAHEQGIEAESRSIVRLSDGPPTTEEAERDLLCGWIDEVLRAVVEIARPTPEGEMAAPIHLVFFNASEQKYLLEALGRHFESIRSATPLYDFVQQVGSLDSSVATFLDGEMRERYNYPLTCPSLYEVASWLRFDWNAGLPLRELFRERLFDGGGFLETLDDGRQWVQRRARYASSVPLEYAYAAWGKLPTATGKDDPWRGFRHVGRAEWEHFAARRLEAMKHVASDLEGNKLSNKSLFVLPDLAQPRQSEPGLEDALEEFLMLERHATLGGWKATRNAPAERRALAGESWVCRYLEEDQDAATLATYRENARIEAKRAAWKAENPDAKQMPRGFERADLEQKVRFRVEHARSGVRAEELVALSGFNEGDRIIVAARYSRDSRLPEDEQVWRQTTVKQMLYFGMKGNIERIEVDKTRDQAWLHVQLSGRAGGDKRGFTFSGKLFSPEHKQLVTIEPDVNEDVASHALTTLDGLRAHHQSSVLLERLQHPEAALDSQHPDAQSAQTKFLEGLQVLGETDEALRMEESKRDFIGGHGSAPFLLVQGPPGTGKTYASSWALLARLQGAMACDDELRILVSCKTHSAIDVLLRGLDSARERLELARQKQPEVFAQYFDARLLDVPLFRYNPKDPKAWPLDEANARLPMLLDGSRQKDFDYAHKRADKLLEDTPYCVLGTTPNGIYRMCAETGAVKNGALFGHTWFGMLLVDEASQMSLPEAVMASLALEERAPIIIVGDPRQMPPIVAHDWKNETRRTFARFKAFASLYDAVEEIGRPQVLGDSVQVLGDAQNVTRESHQVLESDPQVLGRGYQVPRIAFAQSFRLHRDMAEFLRREIYHQDKINYHSQRTQVLEEPTLEHASDFVRAVLNPLHPLVVIVHEEEESVLSNEFEHKLALPILEALSGQSGHGLEARHGLGIVVPHRAQRALMRSDRWNVDTVERFQGDEREAMLFCATESERGHLLRAGGFLFDPRRLNVALSRAKRKMILIAARSVFTGFFADAETFANSLLWKNLLRDTCNVSLLKGEMDGVKYEVRGNDPHWEEKSEL